MRQCKKWLKASCDNLFYTAEVEVVRCERRRDRVESDAGRTTGEGEQGGGGGSSSSRDGKERSGRRERERQRRPTQTRRKGRGKETAKGDAEKTRNEPFANNDR